MADSKEIAKLVYDQLLEDFSPKAAEWVLDKDIRWEGPISVPMKEVDFENVHSWNAFTDDARVNKFEKKIKKGKLKPVILVMRPHKPTKMVVDGHHRSLASKRLGHTVLAYVAHVNTVTGPWDEMHDSQNRHPKLSDKSPSHENTGAVIVIDDGHGNVLATTRQGKKNDLDLPGGRLEEGETAEQAAIRETVEETGVTVTRALLIYAGEGSGNRKHVSVFRALEHNATTLPKFNPEKGEDVRWVKPDDLASDKCTFGPWTRDHFDQLFGHVGGELKAKDLDPATLAADTCAPWLQQYWRLALGGCVSVTAADVDVHLPKFENTAPVGGPQAITTPPQDWIDQAKRGLDDSTFTMPFQSQAQREWMHANHPEMAKRWESHTPKGADLPRKVTADIGSGDVHVDGLSGGYRLQTTTETNPKIPNLRPDIQPTFEQPVPPKAVDIMPTPRWPLSQRIQMAQNVNMISAAKRIRLPTDKFALPDQRKYPIDTAARTRTAAARLEQNKARLSPGDYSKAKAAIGRAAKKFGIHSEYNEPAKATDSRATDHLVPHMRVEATIPHGGSLHVRHLSDTGAVMFGPSIPISDD